MYGQEVPSQRLYISIGILWGTMWGTTVTCFLPPALCQGQYFVSYIPLTLNTIRSKYWEHNLLDVTACMKRLKEIGSSIMNVVQSEEFKPHSLLKRSSLAILVCPTSFRRSIWPTPARQEMDVKSHLVFWLRCFSSNGMVISRMPTLSMSLAQFKFIPSNMKKSIIVICMCLNSQVNGCVFVSSYWNCSRPIASRFDVRPSRPLGISPKRSCHRTYWRRCWIIWRFRNVSIVPLLRVEAASIAHCYAFSLGRGHTRLQREEHIQTSILNRQYQPWYVQRRSISQNEFESLVHWHPNPYHLHGTRWLRKTKMTSYASRGLLDKNKSVLST